MKLFFCILAKPRSALQQDVELLKASSEVTALGVSKTQHIGPTDYNTGLLTCLSCSSG